MRDRSKRIILFLLLLIAGYVWWCNIKALHPRQAEADSQSGPGSQKNPLLGQKPPLQYCEVKINPFRRPDQRTRSPGTDRPAEKRPKPTLQSTVVSRLTGILRKGDSSQAVVGLENHTPLVLSLGDSLVDWELRAITAISAVFQRGKCFDTLWLDTDRR